MDQGPSSKAGEGFLGTKEKRRKRREKEVAQYLNPIPVVSSGKGDNSD